MTRPIALVVQRYGEAVNGGAETAARWLAEQLATRLPVEVITTCATNYTTWEDVYPAGQRLENGVLVHRYPVDTTRDWQRAQRETGLFLLRKRTLEEEIEWVRREGPFSTPLLQHIYRAGRQNTYRAFIFFTYIYATTCLGLPLVPDRSILVPTAHDEPYIYMEVFKRLLHMPRHLVYLTEAERDVVHRITGNNDRPYSIAAVGIDVSPDASAERFRQKYGIHGDFLLYGGRISKAKNIPELLEFFARYREENGRPLKLVLMGQPDLPLEQHPDIIHLGFLSEADKYDALRAATLFVLPSLFESLSIIILEAWLLGTPVLVNGRCEVTRQQARLSNGGLYYASYDEFAAQLDLLLDRPELRATLGQQGRRFVQQRYTGERILDCYEEILSTLD